MKIVYRCDYCGNTDMDRGNMEDHEDNCDFNPINKWCESCKYWSNNRKDVRLMEGPSDSKGYCNCSECVWYERDCDKWERNS